MNQLTESPPVMGAASDDPPRLCPSAEALAVLADADQIGQPSALQACIALGRLEGQTIRSSGDITSLGGTERAVALALLALRNRVGRMLVSIEADAFADALRSALS